jgi:hypothetical protein
LLRIGPIPPRSRIPYVTARASPNVRMNEASMMNAAFSRVALTL